MSDPKRKSEVGIEEGVVAAAGVECLVGGREREEQGIDNEYGEQGGSVEVEG